MINDMDSFSPNHLLELTAALREIMRPRSLA
jgi:hypothetical protein